MRNKLLLSSFFRIVCFFLIILSSVDAKAQCAGSDAAIEICNITDPSSASINLFNLLNGSPLPNGVWRDVDKSGGFDRTTGILNAQKVNKSGIYRFTYTVTGVAGCVDNTAEVVVTIGGYTGVPGPSFSICRSEIAFNLFQVFKGDFISPQKGGVWTGNTNSLGLNNNFLDARELNPGSTYSYTYTIEAIGNCPAPPPATVFITILRLPISGEPADFSLCSNNLDANTNFNLNNLLEGEDSDGTWAEFGTSEITDDDDNTVDLRAIYNNNGPGVYRFEYTVPSKNSVCSDETSEVKITIEQQLDLTGATLTVDSDICEDEITTATYSATLTQGTQPIANGSYEVTYSISGNSPIKTTQSFVGGKFVFPIEKSNFQEVKDYTIKIENIKEVTSKDICTSIIGTIEDVLHVYAIPNTNNATLTINPVCQSENVTVLFSGATNLTDGDYSILYNLSGSNVANSIPAVMNVVEGSSSFVIPSTLISAAGNTTITIVNFVNNNSTCVKNETLKKEFNVSPLPVVTNLNMTANDACQGSFATIKLTGLGTLTAIAIDYSISGANTVAKTTISLAVIDGTVSFTIPSTEIPNVGVSTITITTIKNTLNGCSTATSISKNFSVKLIQTAPIAAGIQSFCATENATVADLVPKGNQYIWYDSLASTQPLAINTQLINGSYYLKERNAFGCESDATKVTVSITNIPISGEPADFSLCSNNLDANTNFNLNNLLEGEDSDGTWAEFGTSEITDDDDNTVDLRAIYNNNGPGVYRFEYTVPSKNSVCSDETSEVKITIEQQLDLTGATLTVDSDICEDEITTATYSATLTQGTQPIANGTYEVTYSISGNSPIKTTQSFVGGKFVFPIEKSNFQEVKDYTIKIENIKEVTSKDICTSIIGTIEDILHVYATPNTNNATLTINPVCQSENVTVLFSGATNLTDGDYSILYNLSGSNVANSIPAVMNVVGGSSSFVIPSTLISAAGNTTITIVNFVNNNSTCVKNTTLKKEFSVNPLPVVTNLNMTANDACQGSSTTIKLTGLGTLTAIAIDYSILGANTVAKKTISLTVINGTVSFTIPLTEIPNEGVSTITITTIKNTLTGCSTATSVSKNFSVTLIQTAPIAVGIQSFCATENATVADLVPKGNQYIWYDSLASSQPLAINTQLINGSYYLKERNAFGCESNATKVSVIVINIPIPVLSAKGQNFCGIDKPTILSLSNNTTFMGSIQWYDALKNGNLLSDADLLSDGATYYGFNFDSTTNCTSSPLTVTVSLKDCIVTPDNFFIPDGFSPNGDGTNDVFQIQNIEFVDPNYTIEIFNRYGNLLFRGNANIPPWDGKNSNTNFIGGESGTGVYFYVIYFNKDNLPPAQGQLYLNR